jgi:hypothetical protein
MARCEVSAPWAKNVCRMRKGKKYARHFVFEDGQMNIFANVKVGMVASWTRVNLTLAPVKALSAILKKESAKEVK